MIWASKFSGGRWGIAAVLATALGGTAIAGPMVVRSAGPSAKAYPAGRQLADTAQLALKAGDTVVLLDARGTRTVNGPGNFAAVGTSARVGTAQTASRILANQGTERRGGAVRGGTPTNEARSPNLWFVDVAKSGTVCVVDASAVRLWRGSSDKPGSIKVTTGAGSGMVDMPQGARVAAWPKAVPVTDGADYMISVDGGTPKRIKFATVAMPSGLEDTAGKLIAKGCQTQLDLLIATTSPVGGSG